MLVSCTNSEMLTAVSSIYSIDSIVNNGKNFHCFGPILLIYRYDSLDYLAMHRIQLMRLSELFKCGRWIVVILFFLVKWYRFADIDRPLNLTSKNSSNNNLVIFNRIKCTLPMTRNNWRLMSIIFYLYYAWVVCCVKCVCQMARCVSMTLKFILWIFCRL